MWRCVVTKIERERKTFHCASGVWRLSEPFIAGEATPSHT